MRKVLVCCLAVFAVLLSTAWAEQARAASLELTLPEVQGEPGQTVKVPILVKNAAGLGALQMELVIEPALAEITAVEPGAILANALVDFKATGNRCTVGAVSSDPVTGGGELLLVTLRATGSGAATLSLQNAQAWENENQAPMIVTASTGSLKIGGAMWLSSWLWPAVALVVLAGGLCFWGIRRKRQSASRAGGRLQGSQEGHACPNCGTQVAYCPCCGAKLER
jgi:hypothetical protein